MHRGILFGLATLAVCLSLTTGVQAGPVGTQGFADTGTPTAGGSATGDINTATSFTIGDLVTNTNQTGFLSGLSTQTFGAVTFDTTSGTSLTFGNSTFGTFASTTITEVTNVAGFVNIYVVGDWTPGSYGGFTGGPYAASFSISFTQTPAHTGSISDSGTFSIPPAIAVPEPTSVVMGLTGLAFGVVVWRHRRRRPQGIVA
jgi:membrane-associated protease RseP (regulator of RpoE activity)